MKKALLITSLSFSLHAGVLLDVYYNAQTDNSDMRLARSALAFQKASSKNAETLDNINIQLDGYSRYYTPQKSSIENASFGIPDATVNESFFKNNLNLTMSKDLYNEGSDTLQELGLEGVQKAGYFFAQNSQDLTLNIIKEYINVLQAYNALQLSKANAYVSEQSHIKALKDKEVGIIDSVELEVIASKKTCLDALNVLKGHALDNALDSFKMLTGSKLNTLALLRDDLEFKNSEIKSFEHYYGLMLKNNPELSQLGTAVEIAKKSVDLVKSKYAPYVNAQIGYEYTQNYTPVYLGRSYESGVFVGVSAVIPLYSGGRNDTATQKAMANIKCESNKKFKVEQALSLILQKKYRLFFSSKEQVLASHFRVISLKNLYEQAKVKTSLGQMLPIELDDIYYSYLQAKDQEKGFKYQHLLSEIEIEHLSGGLNEEDIRRFEEKLSMESISMLELKKGNE